MKSPRVGRKFSAASALIAIVVVVSGSQPVHAASADRPPTSLQASGDADVVTRTTAQIEALGRSVQDNPGRRNTAAALLGPLARERKAALLRLMSTHPDTAAHAFLPDETLNTLGPSAGNLLEHRTTVSGRFSAFHHDGADGTSTVIPQVSTPSGVLNIYSNGHIPLLKAGSAVSVYGYQLDQTVFAYASGSSGAASVNNTSTQAPTTPLGPLNVAVLFGNFSNSTTSLDPNVARNALQGSPGQDVDSWYSEVSYGQSSLNPSFYGPYTLSSSTSGGSCPDLSTAGSQLLSAASSSLQYSQFRRIVLVFNCTGYGASTSVGETSITTPQGTITGGLTYADSTGVGDRYTYAHELAHNLGNYHAAFFVCYPNAFVPPTRFGEGCNSAEYGNEFDTLGATINQPRALPHLDPYHANNAGWFSAGNYVTASAPGTYTYTLQPYENPTTGVLALSIPRGNSGTAFTLHYRQPIGFDSWMGPSNTTYCNSQCKATAGPMLELVDSQTGSGGGSDTQAIDTTPGSIQSNSYYPVSDNRDGALLPGQTFTDPQYGISVTTQSAGPGGATIQVTIPSAATCAHQAPTVSLVSPVTQSVSPGQAATYTVSVTNNDSSSCPAESFRYFGGQLQGVTSSGVTGMFTALGSPDVFTLNPGASTNVNVSLRPASSVVDGSYNFSPASWGGIGVIEADDLSVAPVGFPNVTFQLSSPADATPPSAPSGLSATALGSSTINLVWSPSTDNTGVIGYRILIDNSYIYLSSGPSFLNDNLSSATTHTFSVQGFDQQGNLSPATTTSSSTPTKTDTVAPIVPGGLSATATDRSVTVRWQASSDNVGVVGYSISPFGLFVAAGTTSATIADLSTDTAYQVRVAAVDASGNSSPYYGNSLTVTTGTAGTVPPTQPTGFYSPAATTSGGIQLAWTASTDPVGVTGYYVYRNGRRLATVPYNTYTDAPSDLYAGAGYQYTVEAYDAAGNVSPPTAALQTIAPSTGSSDATPPTGATLSAPANGATVSATVGLSSSPADNVGVSRVEFYIDGVYSGVSYASPFTYAWATAVASNGTHTLYARAYDAAGNYSTSAVTTVTVANGVPDTTSPTAPSNLVASAPSSTQVTLSWGASTDDVGVSGYYVFRNGAVLTTLPAVTAYTDTSGVVAGTSYSYQVEAFDGAGNVSAPSNMANVTTPSGTNPPPPSPGALAGSVASSRGGMISGAKVTVTANGATQTSTTNSSGAYSIASLAAGTYTVSFSAKNYASASKSVTVAPGSTTTLNVTLIHK